ncbi:MAG: thioredoxin domain-containing protein [Planctomycetes bacterium]|nr:thioredoxin domain-containing protein [Planctomycetota bacterium]
MSHTPQKHAPNRLIHSASPYLLQHAYNPVDWWPWSDQAIAHARKIDRPIFLSIGYSTCYWCHVMERECFEDAEIGALLSQHFVCIKVDREERPDLDDLYMAATLAMLGRGGWPMNVVLDPQTLRPFWCGTYIPPTPRQGMPGIRQVVAGLSQAWSHQRSEVLEQASHLADAVAAQLASKTQPVSLGPEPVADAVATLLKMVDRTHGGFGRAPKFPQPVFLQFLLEARSAVDDASRDAIDDAVKLALDRMASGGIRDHLAGGFHRYSVDTHWLVPHFEKMLYDQAQLAQVYALAADAYQSASYRTVAEEIVEFVHAELTLPDGLFCSALDAEVDHREGLNYLWQRAEVETVLSPEDAAAAIRHFGLDKGPNFRDPHHPGDPAQHVLFLSHDSPVTDDAMLKRIRSMMLATRNSRKQPHRDDKVITSWNAMMIASLADCGRVLQRPEYVARAKRSLDALLASHVAPQGEVFRISRPAAGVGAGSPAVLEDYATLALACQAVHAAGPEPVPARHHALSGVATYELAAVRILELAHAHFADQVFGACDTRAGQTDVFLRGRSLHDGAVPSPSSMLVNALRVAAPHSATLVQWFVQVMRAMSGALVESPVNLINGTRCLLNVLTREQPELAVALASMGIGRAGAERSASDEADSPVQVFASTDRVSLSASEPAVFDVVIRIEPPFHILAADPGPSGTSLFPLRIEVAGGSGVVVYADYPQGQPSASDPNLLIHTGQIEFRVVLERDGGWSGRPLLTMMYQACTETECRRAVTVELDVAIDCVG